MPKTRSLVTEAHVQEAVVQMLILDGWRYFRTELTVQRERGRVVGERGMPDTLFFRYGANPMAMVPASVAQVLWIEFKAPGEAPTAHQLAWHEKERARGALVMVFDSLEAALSWYKTSGLMRNEILS